MYNFWIYTLCSFLQFPINVSHRNLRPDQHCCQTQSTNFPQYHRPSVTPTIMIIQGKHTCVYISIALFSDIRKKKIFWSCSEHYSNLICSQLLDSANLYSSNTKYFKLPNHPKFPTMYQLDHVCLWCDIPTVPLQYIRTEIFPVNAQLHCSNYKWPIHFSATK